MRLELSQASRASGTRLLLPAALLAVGVLASSCDFVASPGPTVHISEDGWRADPPTMAQERMSFEITLVNTLDVPVSFVVVHMNYGEPTDLRLIDGVPDVDRDLSDVILGESSNPNVMGPLIAAYYLRYPDVDEVTPDTAPTVGPGEEIKVRIGNPGLGGGDPGRYAVISYQPGGLERGDYVVFDLTDASGEVPLASPIDYCIPDPYEPLRVGDPLQPWQGMLVDGGSFASDSLAGDPALILVNPALDESALGVFQSVVEGHQDEIDAVIVDSFLEERLADRVAQAGLTSRLVVDEEGCVVQAVFRVGWEQPPYWIVIDGEGVIRGLAYGPQSVEEVDALIDESIGVLP